MALERLRRCIETELMLAIERMGEKNQLRNACEYALMNGGKRLRPLIVLMTAESLGKGFEVIPAALSVEYFHTASLIADDLPCMDDDDMRRGQPSLHKAFSEDIAILASYTLIAAGYGGIVENGKRVKSNEVVALCLEAVTRCAGMRGATQGQFLDLYPTDASWETFQNIATMKTASLFEVSFLFGWLFGGGKVEAMEDLRQCAHHLGMAFQIADDLDDDVQDASALNIATICGKEKARERLEREIFSFREGLKRLGLWTPLFQELFSALDRSEDLSAFSWGCRSL